MPRYLINAQYPGSFVEGIGILAPGTEVDLPERLIVDDAYGGKREIVIEPRNSWTPLDDAAKALFAKYRRQPFDPAKAPKRKVPVDEANAPAGFESKGEKLKFTAPKRASDT